jgi:hypothetical protein
MSGVSIGRVGLLCTIMSLAGCGTDGPQIVAVSGKLTRHGKPVPNMEVYFMPDQGRPSVGMSDQEGRFKLGYTREQDGAVLGNHSVFVVYNPPADTGYPPPAELGAISAKYGKQELSPIRIEVKEPLTDLEIKLD